MSFVLTEYAVKTPEVRVFKPSEKECTNQKDIYKRKKTLLCVASDFYPDHVRLWWQCNGKNVTDGVATDSVAKKTGQNYMISSRLRLKAEDWETPENVFRCIVSFFNGTIYEEFTDDISGVEGEITHPFAIKYM